MIEFQNRQLKLPDSSRVVVCRILGSIDGSVLIQFEEKLLGFLHEGIKYLILVFSQVRYINSSGMGILVKLADQFKAAGGEIYLVDVPEKLIALFNMLGLLVVIKISKSEEDALKILQNPKNTMSQAKSPSNVALPSSPKSQPTAQIKKQLGSSVPTAAPTTNPAKVNSSAKVNSPAAVLPAKPSAPKPLAQPVSPTSQPAAKTFIVKCQKCKSNISLGVKLRPGTYKCPRCMTMFKILESGKISFLPS